MPASRRCSSSSRARPNATTPPKANEPTAANPKELSRDHAGHRVRQPGEDQGATPTDLVPHRGQIVAAKAIASVAVAVVTVPLAFGIGSLGNLVGTGLAGTDPVWDLTVLNLATIVLANVLGLMFGFMLGVVIRNSVGALVAYVVYQFLLPTLSLILAASQNWFRDLQPWVDFDYAQSALFNAALTSQQWAHLAFTGTIWLIIPVTIGLTLVMKDDVT